MSKIRVWSAFSRHKHVGPFMKEPIYRHAGRKKKYKKKHSIVDDSDFGKTYRGKNERNIVILNIDIV